MWGPGTQVRVLGITKGPQEGGIRESGQLGRRGWAYPCSKDHPHPRNQALKTFLTHQELGTCRTPNPEPKRGPTFCCQTLPSTRGRKPRTGQGVPGTPPFSTGTLPLWDNGQEDSAVTCSKNSQPFAWLSGPCCSLVLHHFPHTHSTSDTMDLNVFRSFLTTGPLHWLCPLPGARTPSCTFQTSVLTSLPPRSLLGPPLDQVYFMFSDLQLIICEIMRLFTSCLHWELQHRASGGRPLPGALSGWLLAGF